MVILAKRYGRIAQRSVPAMKEYLFRFEGRRGSDTPIVRHRAKQFIWQEALRWLPINASFTMNDNRYS